MQAARCTIEVGSKMSCQPTMVSEKPIGSLQVLSIVDPRSWQRFAQGNLYASPKGTRTHPVAWQCAKPN
ncbi:hypothetical protein N7468_001801 [Penicillium chermesinum]|uniref:Uncharacterized protein n=1 Tax=Penicillium chermesinum TaxID=63820 RepID=A0A9W9TXQ5_9EURO|nr:uncharacterized protein N7468_001801 [Penicillium chermesinum]KAJ5246818.1 hypothetical protein N7468_001801 [Penicillium chermesinum]KAJ6145077.1 hypothetical protein N7470_008972 [Penicillium chermesinum]